MGDIECMLCVYKVEVEWCISFFASLQDLPQSENVVRTRPAWSKTNINNVAENLAHVGTAWLYLSSCCSLISPLVASTF